jgi:magnesium transporter
MNKRMIFMKRKRSIPGLPPGTIHDILEEHFSFYVIVYNEHEVFEKEITQINQLKEILKLGKNTWIQIKDIQKSNIVKEIGSYFHLHPLILEDIMDTNQHPKINDFDIPFFDNANDKVCVQQVSLVLGENYVITFQESDAPLFLPVRERLLKNKGHIRKMKPDYLAYALIDLIVDHFFIVIEDIEERIDMLENIVIMDDSPVVIHQLHKNKQVIISLRKSILAIRELSATWKKVILH